MRAAAVFLAAVLVLAACDGDEGEVLERTSSPPPPLPATTTAPEGRGLAPSNEQEMQELLARTLRAPGTAPGRPRCVTVRRLSPSTARFSCRTGASTYRIDWEHYGTGAYVISAIEEGGRARRIARGTLTISE